MSEINILSKEVYQLIAAGEVVERPSSVVKEMIENSVDAGAKNITVEIKNGGSTYIRITDDGCGIERSQVKKVFVSHATSKIKNPSDLDAIGTLGFRGEAMASIAAVAKTELLTRAAGEAVGTKYEIAGGEEISLDDAGCPEGTTIVVRDLFYNTPARMKFLKKDVTEGNSVAGIVDRMAISHPGIAFRFIRDGKQTLITAGNGDLKGTIYSVFGKELSEGLIPVDYTYENMRVSGFVSKPSASRKSRAMQFFFINGRLVKSKTAMAALEQAYKNSIMTGRFPACILNIELDTALVDVNVHPAKTEIRFANEKPVFQAVYYAVKSAVETRDTIKEAHFTPKAEKIYESLLQRQVSGKINLFKKTPEAEQTVLHTDSKPDFWQIAAPKSKYDLNAEYEDEKALRTNTVPAAENAAPPEEQPAEDKTAGGEIPAFRLVGEAFQTYIIIELDGELYFIDKHAAHERMNYERMKAETEIARQVLLVPAAVNLLTDEYEVISQNIDLLDSCGFEVELFGENAVIVRAVPALLDTEDVKDLIQEIAQKLLEHKSDIIPEKMDWIFHSASCRSAVKAGDHTSHAEQELFVKKLLSMPQIRYCPHGRPVFIKISKYDIEKQFGRTGA